MEASEIANRNLLRASAEGDVDTVQAILDDETVIVDWSAAMFEAAFATQTPPQKRKEVLRILSHRYSGDARLCETFCDDMFEIGAGTQ